MAELFNENKQLAYNFGASVARNYELAGSKKLETEIDSGLVFVRNSTASDAPFTYGLLIIESSRLKNDTRMTTILNYFGKSIKENELLFYAVENVDVCLKSKL